MTSHCSLFELRFLEGNIRFLLSYMFCFLCRVQKGMTMTTFSMTDLSRQHHLSLCLQNLGYFTKALRVCVLSCILAALRDCTLVDSCSRRFSLCPLESLSQCADVVPLFLKHLLILFVSLVFYCRSCPGTAI